MPVALKAAWTIEAGLIPGVPRPEFTRRFEYTSDQAEQDADLEAHQHAEFSKIRATAIDYYLQVSFPQVNNWANIAFIWY
jgi:hypothetical protein